MTELKISERAKEYYEKVRPSNIFTGFEKNLVTDGYKFMFVKGDYEIKNGEVIFRVRTLNKNTIIDLVKSKL